MYIRKRGKRFQCLIRFKGARLAKSFRLKQNAERVNNPYLVSLFSIEEDNITIIYYFTKNPSDRFITVISFKSLTPLVLLNGKLIGWGEESLRRAQDKYDITIKKDFDIKVE